MRIVNHLDDFQNKMTGNKIMSGIVEHEVLTWGRLGEFTPLHGQHLVGLPGVQPFEHCLHNGRLPLLVQVTRHVLQIVLRAVVSLHLIYIPLD